MTLEEYLREAQQYMIGFVIFWFFLMVGVYLRIRLEKWLGVPLYIPIWGDEGPDIEEEDTLNGSPI